MAFLIQSIDEIPSLTSLYKSSDLQPSSSALRTSTPFTPSAKLNDTVCLVRADITRLGVSAIVNAANSSLLGGGGVDGVIHARAGPSLLDECRTLGGCPTGSAKITDAYDLACDKVIHAVGPRYWISKRDEDGLEVKQLKGCYVTALDLAKEHCCKSIAFSCISTGIYGYPPAEAANVACEAVRTWLMENEHDRNIPEKVVFCCFERKDEAAYEAALPRNFPPIENEAPEGSVVEEEALVKQIPDAPTGEPVESGLPSAKKQKTGPTPETREDEDFEDWETIERTTQSAINGLQEVDEGQRSTSLHEDVMTQEKKEQTVALHSAQVGGDPPQSELEKD